MRTNRLSGWRTSVPPCCQAVRSTMVQECISMSAKMGSTTLRQGCVSKFSSFTVAVLLSLNGASPRVQDVLFPDVKWRVARTCIVPTTTDDRRGLLLSQRAHHTACTGGASQMTHPGQRAPGLCLSTRGRTRSPPGVTPVGEAPAERGR